MNVLLGNCSIVGAWQGGRLVGIGQGASDGVLRAVLGMGWRQMIAMTGAWPARSCRPRSQARRWPQVSGCS